MPKCEMCQFNMMEFSYVRADNECWVKNDTVR